MERRDRGRSTTGEPSWSRKAATNVVVRLYRADPAVLTASLGVVILFFFRPRDDDRLATPFFFWTLLLGFFSYQLATLLQAARPVDD